MLQSARDAGNLLYGSLYCNVRQLSGVEELRQTPPPPRNSTEEVAERLPTEPDADITASWTGTIVFPR